MSGALPSGSYEFDVGRLLSDNYSRDAPPTEGGRWGLSLRATLPEVVAVEVDALTRSLLPIVGPGHWPTGLRGSGHVTLQMIAPWHADNAPEALLAGHAMLASLPPSHNLLASSSS